MKASPAVSDADVQKRWDAAVDRILWRNAIGYQPCCVIDQGRRCWRHADGGPLVCSQHRDVVLPDWVVSNWNAEGPATSIYGADMALLDDWGAGRLWLEEQSRSGFDAWCRRQEPDQRSERKSCVYFLIRGDAIKIGKTVSLRERIRSFQQTEADVLGTIPGGYQVERRWHKTWAHLRIHGEWFQADDDLLDAIDQAASAFAHA